MRDLEQLKRASRKGAKANRDRYIDLVVQARMAWEKAPRYTEEELTWKLVRKTCPTCGTDKIYAMSRSPYEFACKNGHQYAARSGTMYQRSAVPLVKWYKAQVMMTATGGKVSANILSNELAVMYNTAWRMKKILEKEP